jgi:pumilio RNA-binding family
MNDVFGNYVVQKILELGNGEQRLALFQCAKNKITELSLHTYGCRVIQKILEEFKSNKQIQDEIISELKQQTLKLIEDQNGNHVIQKCFETIPSEKLKFIVDVVINTINELAFHPYGCRVIQRILEHSSSDKTAPILKKLMGNVIKLCECQYGNYIMQHILEKGPPHEKEILLDTVKDNFIKLSLNKFASNVTEKSVINSSPEFRKELVNLLLKDNPDNTCGLMQLMNHAFGNYVAQRLFECGDDNTRRRIYNKIQAYDINDVKRNPYGKHVLGFIEKNMEQKGEN